ncbi:carbonic anhydrase [Pseudonocardia sediminis]|uniref:carbonic anhydrase n=1 Tax=Pseudonocardia sediminis TaxID=1397368 RepID=UPI0013EEFD1B|nr:carbonic anhydrase [Pseudonocardia sediminis]
MSSCGIGSARPRLLVIACDDAQVALSRVAEVESPEMFELRTVRGRVPWFTGQPTGAAAVIDYVVAELQVSRIIVLGHVPCGHNPGGLRSVANVKSFAGARARSGDTRTRGAAESRAAQSHVVRQVCALRGYPVVRDAIVDRGVKVDAWLHDATSGSLQAYAPSTRTFVSL